MYLGIKSNIALHVQETRKCISFLWDFFFACRLQCLAQMTNNDVMYIVSKGKMCLLCGCTVQQYHVHSYYTSLFFITFAVLPTETYFSVQISGIMWKLFQQFFKCICDMQCINILYHYTSKKSQNWGGNNTKVDVYLVDWSFWDWCIPKECISV